MRSRYVAATTHPSALPTDVNRISEEKALKKLKAIGMMGTGKVEEYIYPGENETHYGVNLRRGLVQVIIIKGVKRMWCSPCQISVGFEEQTVARHLETATHLDKVKKEAGLKDEIQVKSITMKPCFEPDCRHSKHRSDYKHDRKALDKQTKKAKSTLVNITLKDQTIGIHSELRRGSAKAVHTHPVAFRGHGLQNTSSSTGNTEGTIRIKRHHAANGPPPQSPLATSIETGCPQVLPAMGRPQTIGKGDGTSFRHQVIVDGNLSPVSASSSVGPITPPPLPPYQNYPSQSPAHMLAGTPHEQYLAYQQPSMNTATHPHNHQDGAGPSTGSTWYGSIFGCSHGGCIDYGTDDCLYDYGYEATPCFATATSIAIAAMSAPRYDSPFEATDAPISTGAAAHPVPEALAFEQLSMLFAADYVYGPVPMLDFTPVQLEAPLLTPEENLHFAELLNCE